MTAKPNKPCRQAMFAYAPKAEIDRVKAFAKATGRPQTWIIRDAVRVYLDAVEADPRRVAALRAPLPPLNGIGRTQTPKRGRPRKRGFGLPPDDREIKGKD